MKNYQLVKLKVNFKFCTSEKNAPLGAFFMAYSELPIIRVVFLSRLHVHNKLELGQQGINQEFQVLD